MTKADNDNIRVLEIRGTSHPDDLFESLLEMSLTSELTKTDKGLYHVQICPAYGEDKLMRDEDWIRAADIMETETGFVGQKRAIVLHDKKGKLHAHVTWERYDHDTGLMKSNKFSRLAQDRARGLIEREFGHYRTPERNKRRPEMKEFLSEVWQKCNDAQSFMNVIKDKGYVIAAGTQRPYMVVDDSGRSFNLVRQLENVKTGEVRDRFKTLKLAKEKEVIEQVRINQARSSSNKPAPKIQVNDNVKQHVERDKSPKATDKPLVMQIKFEIEGNTNLKASEQLKSAIDLLDEKQKRKQELLEKIRRERLEKAKQFRDNERDL